MRTQAKTQQNKTQGVRWVFFWAGFFQSLFFTLDTSANPASAYSVFGEQIAHSYSYKMFPSTLLGEPLNALSNQKFILAGGHRLDPPTDPNQPEQNLSEEVQTTTGSFPSDLEADTNQSEQNLSEEVRTRSFVEGGTPEPANDENQSYPAKTDEEAKLELVRLRFNKAGADYKSKNYRRAFNQFLEIATKDDFPQAQFNLAVMLRKIYYKRTIR